MLQKLYGFNLELRIGATHWDHFGKSIEIRNRITHPKSSNNFRISDEDLQNIREVSSWFCDVTDALEQLYTITVVPRLHAIDQNLNQISDSINKTSDKKMTAIVTQHIQEIKETLKNMRSFRSSSSILVQNKPRTQV